MKRDLFSDWSEAYARYRPRYPAELYAYLARIAPHRARAWDCATGSGQAALGLADHFAFVTASDASRRQLAHAHAHPRVAYLAATADAPPLASASVDLVTVAQALHWLDTNAFFEAARNVLRPGGVVAVWCYDRRRAAPDLEKLLDDFYSRRVGAYWLPERRLVEERYETIPFPFEEPEVPAFAIRVRWSLAHLLGYLGTWSAVRRAQADGNDPMPGITADLAAVWGKPERERALSFPLHLRVGCTG